MRSEWKTLTGLLGRRNKKAMAEERSSSGRWAHVSRMCFLAVVSSKRFSRHVSSVENSNYFKSLVFEIV